MLTSAGVSEEGYEISDRGTIASPGKFEGEPWWVVALWFAALEGEADRETDDDDTSPVSWFQVDTNLISFLDLDGSGMYPVIDPLPIGSWIGVWETSDGFVHHEARNVCSCVVIGSCPICAPEGHA